MLQTQNLRFSYTRQSTLSFPNLNCLKGEHWLLLGQSGSGKTTLLHLLGGLLRPTSGNIIIDNQYLNELPDSKLDYFRGQHIGIIFQTPHFVQALNVEENLLLAQHLAGKKTDKKRATELLEQLNLGHKGKSKANNLSQGEQQRVVIARALINNPSIILADEPTSALDDINCHQVMDLLENQAKEQNATLLIVTHDQRLKERFSKQITLKGIRGQGSSVRK